MALAANRPQHAGGIQQLALHTAAQASQASIAAMFADLRVGTLQQIPAPVVHTDLVPPFPVPVRAAVPLPSATGAYSTAYALEDG